MALSQRRNVRLFPTHGKLDVQTARRRGEFVGVRVAGWVIHQRADTASMDAVSAAFFEAPFDDIAEIRTLMNVAREDAAAIVNRRRNGNAASLAEPLRVFGQSARLHG